MNGYVCFYNGKRVEVYANTTLEALDKAMEQFKPPKSKRHMVSVVLAEKGGESVVHTADF